MQPDEVIVLAGGGVESTTLLRDALAAGATVVPVFVECGLLWERGGRRAVMEACRYLATPRLRDLETITVDLSGLMPRHLVGDPASAVTVTTTAQLEVPLRNLMLTSIAANAFRHGGPLTLILGTTADNSFGDGSRPFFDACQTVLSLDLGAAVRIETPYIALAKWQVIQSSEPRLLALSWSCVSPAAIDHCGRCIKCRRRHEAFRRAGVADPTRYESLPD